uniref:FACT complex subunit SSRP1 n=1 Tax=Mantoniella antarctica TaxID=81844 RepID=A0A7S0X9T3_9CHLO|mmetsp:Transcript_30654/g.76780  ORF Transcript_30654/g.76780 Transcript_30654/m.76780 type:complete len:705 (+) Transcript_30654:310-2424(+)
MSSEQTFGSISLIGRGVPVAGGLKLGAAGITWKKAGGGRSVDVPKKDIEELTYEQVPGGVVITVRRKGGKGEAMRLKGFKGGDLSGLKELCQANYSIKLEKREAQVNGRNWGEVDLDYKNAMHFSVDGKTSFEVSTADISACSLASKHEVMVMFHVDDTVAAAAKDTLVEMSFYVPPSSANWGVEPDEENPDETGAKRLQEAILELADTDAAAGDPIAEFDGVSLLAPRGKVTIELHASHLRLTGAAAEFKIQYGSIQRLFLLPKPNNAQVYAVLHLDPPIRKGQTFYPHIVAVFNANEELEVEPALDDDLRAKFSKLEETYDGPSSEVFVRLLKAVSGCKLSRQGTFLSTDGGCAVKASHKAEVGHLFPLEKSFFYLPKPSLLLQYAEVETVEFERHAGGGGAASMQRTFDVVITMKSDVSHTFHSIPKSEFQNFVNFLNAKQLKISNVGDGNARADRLIDDDDDDEPAPGKKSRARADDDEDGGAESSEEDEEYAAGSDDDDGGEPSDASDSDGSDGDSDGGGSDSGANKGAKKKKAPAAAKKAAAGTKAKKAKAESGSDSDGGGSDSDAEQRPKKKVKKAPAAKKGKEAAGAAGKKTKKAKKDPNAPKRPLSSYIIFSQETRSAVLSETPGLSLGKVSQALGARWRVIDPEDKAAFEQKAKEAKAKYEVVLKEYNATKEPVGVVHDDDSEEEAAGAGSDSD